MSDSPETRSQSGDRPLTREHGHDHDRDRDRDRDRGSERERDHGVDPAGAVVGTLVALAGGLFLLQPFVGFVVVGRLGVRPVVLSAVALAVAMLAGGALFGLAGRRRLAIGHGGTGVGWTLLLVGTVGVNGVALLAGAGAIGGTAAFLVAERRRA